MSGLPADGHMPERLNTGCAQGFPERPFRAHTPRQSGHLKRTGAGFVRGRFPQGRFYGTIGPWEGRWSAWSCAGLKPGIFRRCTNCSGRAFRQSAGGDYTPAELSAWADRAGNITAERLLACYTLVAEEHSRLLGFANLEPGGHLDCLYTAAESQRRGVAAALCDALEAEARRQGETLLQVEASRTARGFFERRGYKVTAAQLVPVDGERLENFRMRKTL